MDPRDSVHRAFWRLELARASLFWERLVACGWLLVAVTLIGLSLAFSDVLPHLPSWLHGALLGSIGLCWAGALHHFWRRFSLPTSKQVRRRIEQHNNLKHYPLEALNDHRIGGDGAIGSALWRAHQRRAAETVLQLETPTPRPQLTKHDRFGVFNGSLIIFVVACLIGWGDMSPRLARAVTPFERVGEGTVSIALWLSPPDYTGRAPVALPVLETDLPNDGIHTTEIYQIPSGTKIVGTITAPHKPNLTLGDISLPFEEVLNGYRLETQLTESGPIQLKLANRIIGTWHIAIDPDSPPTIQFDRSPQTSERQNLEVAYSAADDYGLNDITLILHPRDQALRHSAPLEISLPLAAERPRRHQSIDFHDLTTHPWAGLQVGAFLQARDSLGQIGRSDVIAVILPERAFTHPVAKRLIEARKLLLTRAEQEAPVAAILRALAKDPAAFDHQAAVYLGMRIAANRLLSLGPDADRGPLSKLLWDMALAIEEGELFFAEQELKRAEEDLRRALDDPNVSATELDALMQRFNDALQTYLAAMADRNKHSEQSDVDLTPLLNGLEPTDLSRMIEQMRTMSRAGARDAARQMLSQMRSLLENLRVLEPGQEMENLAETMRSLSLLDQLVSQQENLMTETLRRRQEQGDEANTIDLADDQAMIRSDLQDLLDRLRRSGMPVPQPLQNADGEMQNAEQSLTENDAQQALNDEGRALDMMQRAGHDLRNMLQEMAGQGLLMNNQSTQQMNRDPLGRPTGTDAETIKVPDGDELDRAWKTLQELHRRAAEPDRPSDELDYFNRLLKRF